MKAKRIIFNIVSALLGLLFINGGLSKIFHYMPPPKDMPEPAMKDMAAMAEISWLMPLVSVAELVGGLLVLFPRTRAVGALVLFPIIIGILLTNIYTMPSGLPIAGVILAILLWIMWENREKYFGLLR